MKIRNFWLFLFILLFAACAKTNDTSKVELNKTNTTIVQNKNTSKVQNNENISTNTNTEKKQESGNKESKESKGNEGNKKAEDKTNSDEAFVKLIISKNSGKEIIVEKKVKIVKNTNAMMILKENAEVYEEGGFIKSINGLSSIPQNNLSDEEKQKGILGYDWFIYYNGKKTNVGANDIALKNGDIINFDYKGWTIEDLVP